MRILIVEDHQRIARNLQDYFAQRGHRAAVASDGAQGFDMAVRGKYDAIVLDIGLPNIDGISVCRRLRNDAHVAIPILMLTARDALDDKLSAFNEGADDYVVKPFALPEIEARLMAMHKRRSGKRLEQPVRIGDLCYDPASAVVTMGGTPAKLAPQSLRLLEVMLFAPERVHSRQELELELWGELQPTSDRLRNRIHVLRTALAGVGAANAIRSVPGVGFALNV